MAEPITLFNRAGETLHVYTRSQADALLAGGDWYASAADAEAGKVRPEPTPATAAKLDALEGDGGAVVVESTVTESAPPKPAPRKGKAKTQ